MTGLKGKCVLVTGGTSGIGQAIAVRFAQEGANVAINYRRRPEDADKTVEQVRACATRVRQHGVQDVIVKGDVSDATSIEAMFAETFERLGGVDVLVNNAGVQIADDSDSMSVDAIDTVLGVNLRGAFLCAQQAIRHFLATNKPGVIINVSSVHEVIPKPRFVGYSMSKGGLQNMTRTLALEYAGRGVRVNAVAPGATVTPINRSWVDDPVKAEQVLRHIPMGRAGRADEMGAVATFLASDEAGYITGQTIFVDGGLTLYPDFRTPWSSE